MIVALGGAIFVPDWILYWHMKWINIFNSELECFKFHYTINKMKGAVNLVQSPWGKLKPPWNSTYAKSSLEAKVFLLHLLSLLCINRCYASKLCCCTYQNVVRKKTDSKSWSFSALVDCTNYIPNAWPLLRDQHLFPFSFPALFLSLSLPFLQFLTNLTSFFMLSGVHFVLMKNVLLIAMFKIRIIPQIACCRVAMGPNLLLGSSLGCLLTLKY